MVLSSLLYAFTLGSIGSEGRNFWTDLAQVEQSNLWSAIMGGIVFNAGNILLSASISIAGMAVAFPVGVGIALVLGVIIYMGSQSGNPLLLGLGVLFIVCAIILNSLAYKSTATKEDNKSSIKKWLILPVFTGLLMAFFYRFIASSMDLENFANPLAGKMTPYTAFFIFSIGVLISNMLFNSILIKKPFVGKPTSYKAYFSGSFANHLPGILGGLIWGTGNVMNLVAAGKAGAAISYGLGQAATLVAAFWGVIIWKEFKNSSKKVTNMLVGMFLLFLIGIVLIIMAGNE